MADFAPVFAGWNVWNVWQKNDLDFEAAMVGLDRSRRLRIWVEDAVRLGAPGAVVADPLDLKGGQVEVLPTAPPELETAARKEGVGGPAMLLDGPATLRTVRFYNRGAPSKLVWPHDSNYLLDSVLTPSTSSQATTCGPPGTIAQGVGSGVANAASEAGVGKALVGIGLAVLLGALVVRKLS